MFDKVIVKKLKIPMDPCMAAASPFFKRSMIAVNCVYVILVLQLIRQEVIGRSFDI